MFVADTPTLSPGQEGEKRGTERSGDQVSLMSVSFLSRRVCFR